MENNVKIYKLIDPRTNEIRYIGKTISLLQRRLRCHIHTAKNGNNHKDNWIKNILNDNLRPIIELVEMVPEKDWEEREKYWIAYYNSIGVNLTNATDGGSNVSFIKKEYFYGQEKSKTKLTHDQCQSLIHMYYTGSVFPEIVQRFNIHPCTVTYILNKFYVVRRATAKPKRYAKQMKKQINDHNPYKRIKQEDFYKIKRMYENGVGIREISRIFNAGFGSIRHLLINTLKVHQPSFKTAIKPQDRIYVYKLRQRGLYLKDLAKIFKCTQSAITTALKLHSQ